MNRIISIIVLLVATSCALSMVRADELPSAFNGKDLKGWVAPEGNIWWKVENGALQCKSGPENKGSVLWSEKAYGNFIMELQFKFGEGKVDTGVFLRTEHEQIQIGISGSLKRDMTASPYIVGKGYPIEANGVKDLLKLDDWNSMTIVAKGANYTVWLNGKLVVTYDSETAAVRGHIGLQLHQGRAMSFEYRDIRLAELR